MKRPWLFLLGGPLIWAFHFAAIYATASLFHVLAGRTDGPARAITIGLSGLCLVACVVVLLKALRPIDGHSLSNFWRAIAATGALLALIAIVWQTLPALAPIGGTPPPEPS